MSTETSVVAIVEKFPDTSAKDWRRRAKYTMYDEEARVFENVKTKQFCTVYELGNATVVKEGNMFPATDPELMKRLIKAGNTIKHCGDYCNMYWNPTDNTVWMEMGDGDCDDEGTYTSGNKIESILRSAGALEVLVEAEHGPSWNRAHEKELRLGRSVEEDAWNYYRVGAVKGITVDME